jgi:hypothetical protein
VNLLLLEELSDFSFHLLSGLFGSHLVLTDHILQLELTLDDVPGWDHMVVVDIFHEGLQLGPSIDLLGTHLGGHSQRVSLDACD